MLATPCRYPVRSTPASTTGGVFGVDNTVIDLMAGEVAEARITHPDGETVTARKVSADDPDFGLVELPEGRASGAWQAL